jgi:frataxin-like iron-binding protein CyaY
MIRAYANLLLLLLLTSCVGEVASTKLKGNDFVETSSEKLFYDGLRSATAVASDKIDIFFEPYSGSKKVKYLVFLQGATVPIELNEGDLDLYYNGLYRYTLSGLAKSLNQFDAYQIRVKVRVYTGSNYEDSYGDKALEPFVLTMLTDTTNFLGVRNLSLVPGQSDRAIKVEWTPAVYAGTFFAPLSTDPAYYEIKLIGQGGASNLNNNSYGGSDRRVVITPQVPLVPNSVGSAPITSNTTGHPNSVTIENLQPNTTYTVQVRAVGHGFYNNMITQGAPQTLNRELNTKYLRIKTSGALNSALFVPDNNVLSLKNTAGVEALNSIQVSWKAPQGSYRNYRVYYRKYAANRIPFKPEEEDLLSLGEIMTGQPGNQCVINNPSDSTKINCQSIADPSKTLSIINGLDPLETYQFKVGVCLNADCVVTNDEQVALRTIFTNFKALKTEPALPDFSGLIGMENPDDVANLDRINLNIIPPVLSQGYANKIEVHCFKPGEITDLKKVSFPKDGSTIALADLTHPCHGLRAKVVIDSDLENLNQVNESNLKDIYQLKVSGVKNINDVGFSANYCFSVSLAIDLPAYGSYYRGTPFSSFVTKCISPEIITPSREQFVGMTEACSVNKDSLTVNWVAPSKGLYSHYKLFWKIKDEKNYSFKDGIAGLAAYSNLELSDTNLNQTLSGLQVGVTYEVGVLSYAKNGSNYYFSEDNFNIASCNIPMPKAKAFEGFTRIFAIGPKVDGRYPIDLSLDNENSIFHTDALIVEALNQDAIPYEVEAGASPTFSLPPGFYKPLPQIPVIPDNQKPEMTNFTQDFDGVSNTEGKASSKKGIISLAWKNVELDFKTADFNTSQNHASLRDSRKTGYNIYRSEDNKLSWVKVNEAPIHSADYSYLPRSNASTVMEKMAFFTDYSVSFSESKVQAERGVVERGRIYYYKIVPVYIDGKGKARDLQYLTESKGHHIVKVILPPPNMALVHRWMSNRTACMEIDREDEINLDQNYSCPFIGVGAKPSSSPWKVGEGIIDQGGDLLVDRFELGCNITRGDLINGGQPQLGNSYFYLSPLPNLNSTEAKLDPAPGNTDDLEFTSLYFFKGRAIGSSGADLGPLLGCTGVIDQDHNQLGLDSSAEDDINSINPLFWNSVTEQNTDKVSYKNVLFGDCVSSDSLEIVDSYVAPENIIDLRVATASFPGVNNHPELEVRKDGSTLDFESRQALFASPDYVSSFSNPDFLRNIFTQSEYAAVFYNRVKKDVNYYSPNPLGPNGGIINSSHTLAANQCYINLAAIGADSYWKARWIPSNGLDRLRGESGSNVYKKNLTQLSTNTNLYDNDKFKAIDDFNENRLHENLPLGKIFSTNSSKNFPLLGLDQTQMNKLCNSYQITLGTEKGAVFKKVGKSYEKKLLRRSQFISSAAWPETYATSKIGGIEGAVEAALGSGSWDSEYSCNNFRKKDVMLESSIARGAKLNDRMALKGNSHTGSSSLDGSSTSSELCISKYGIQDLVGNLAERTSDRLFCDYKLDKLYLGIVGDERNSIVINQNGGSDQIPNFHENVTIVDSNGDPIISNARPWAKPDSRSGYCGVVDNEVDILTDNLFEYQDGNNIAPLKDVFGSLDSAIAPIQNSLDSYAPESMRNTDGTFLVFGKANLAPGLSTKNTLNIKGPLDVSNIAQVNDPGDKIGEGKYFSTLLGLPLLCSATPPYDPCSDDGKDNLLVSVDYLNDNLSSGDINPPSATIDFPIVNSEVYNTGVAEIQNGPNSPREADFVVQGQANNAQVVLELQLTSAAHLDLDRDDLGSYLISDQKYMSQLKGSENPSGSDYDIYTINWVIDRSDPDIEMISGGSYLETHTGRYTMTDIDSYNVTTGGRCMIFIEE